MMESPIQTIGTIDLDGFQVVKAELFAHLPRTYSPSCTLWPSKICFNKQALQALNNCETVLIQVNAVTKGLVVMPVHSRDKDAVRWVKGQKTIDTRTMEAKRFCDELYKTWDLDRSFNYRTPGRLVTAGNKIVLYFNFAEAEKWTSQPKKGLSVSD